jgi:hypothetical protein
MPKIFITKTLSPKIVENTVREFPRSTINRISEEVGSRDWYQEAMPTSTRRLLEREKSKPGRTKSRGKDKVAA